MEEAYLRSRRDLPGTVWAAVDTHQVPYWGRGKLARFQKGWSGSHSRRLRGYRLLLAIDTETGQAITFALARTLPRAQTLIALLARRLRQLLGQQLAGIVADCGFTSKWPSAFGCWRGTWRLASSSRRRRAAPRSSGSPWPSVPNMSMAWAHLTSAARCSCSRRWIPTARSATPSPGPGSSCRLPPKLWNPR